MGRCQQVRYRCSYRPVGTRFGATGVHGTGASYSGHNDHSSPGPGANQEMRCPWTQRGRLPQTDWTSALPVTVPASRSRLTSSARQHVPSGEMLLLIWLRVRDVDDPIPGTNLHTTWSSQRSPTQMVTETHHRFDVMYR